MASMYKRLLDARTLTASWFQPTSDAVDCGGYNKLQAQCRVLKAGTGGAGTLKLQHAAVNEADAYKEVANLSWAVNAEGNLFTTVPDFLRYVRAFTDSGVAGGPVVTVDLIAKE